MEGPLYTVEKIGIVLHRKNFNIYIHAKKVPVVPQGPDQKVNPHRGRIYFIIEASFDWKKFFVGRIGQDATGNRRKDRET